MGWGGGGGMFLLGRGVAVVLGLGAGCPRGCIRSCDLGQGRGSSLPGPQQPLASAVAASAGPVGHRRLFLPGAGGPGAGGAGLCGGGGGPTPVSAVPGAALLLGRGWSSTNTHGPRKSPSPLATRSVSWTLRVRRRTPGWAELCIGVGRRSRCRTSLSSVKQASGRTTTHQSPLVTLFWLQDGA